MAREEPSPEYRFFPKFARRALRTLYGSANRRVVYLNPVLLDREQDITVVYLVTHEYLHWWLWREFGPKAARRLDRIGYREHFPMTETEPVLLPVRWGGRHKRSFWNLVWAYIAFSTWRAKQERMTGGGAGGSQSGDVAVPANSGCLEGAEGKGRVGLAPGTPAKRILRRQR